MSPTGAPAEAFEIPVWGWLAFATTVAVLLAVDLYSHRGGHADSRRAAFVWSGVWIAAGLAFNGFVWAVWGSGPGLDYLGAYLMEKSLSLDNLFVWLVIFRSVGLGQAEQRTALSWGVFGALVFRALFIFLGVSALQRWEGVTWIFAGILVFAAIHVFREDPADAGRESRLVRWLKDHWRVSETSDGNRLFTRSEGRFELTPLLVAIVAVELTDVAFAVDSVPAALSITREPFLVYSSNVFAILGLRALYVALAQLLQGFQYLHYGLAAVLLFAALKLAAASWFHVPALLSIGIIVGLVGGSLAASLLTRGRVARGGEGRD